jgi:hypothetical protein
MSKLYAEQDISKLPVLKSNNYTIAMKVSGVMIFLKRGLIM